MGNFIEDNLLLFIIVCNSSYIVVLLLFYRSRIRRVGPNQAIIVSGRRDGQPARVPDEGMLYRVVIGGRTFIWPIVEKFEYLSLEPIRAELKLNKLVTGDGKRVSLVGKVQFKIKSEKSAVHKAAQHFLSKSEEEKKALIIDMFENNLRRIVEESPREEIEQSPMKFGDKVVEAGRPKMDEIGIEVLSLIIEQVS